MKMTLDYEADRILVDGEPLGIKLSDAKADVVFSGDAGRGIVRLFVEFDDIAIVHKKPYVAPAPEPDLMDEISEADKFEIEMERIRRGGPNHG